MPHVANKRRRIIPDGLASHPHPVLTKVPNKLTQTDASAIGWALFAAGMCSEQQLDGGLTTPASTAVESEVSPPIGHYEYAEAATEQSSRDGSDSESSSQHTDRSRSYSI